MIKRFHQLNESVSGLRDLDFFKDYFIDLLDLDYTISIEEQKYVKINQEYDEGEYYDKYAYSNFPKKDFFPCYQLYLKSTSNKGGQFYSSKGLKTHAEICKTLADCVSYIENNSELKVIESIECSQHVNPFIRIKIADIYEIPEEELPNQFFEEFVELIKERLQRLNYTNKFKLTPNPKEMKVSLDGVCHHTQLQVLINDFAKHNKKSEREDRYSDITIFDVNFEKRGQVSHIELSNPRLVKKTTQDED